MALIKRQVGMDLDYYYFPQYEPAARNKVLAFFWNLSLQGVGHIRLFFIEGRILLHYELAAGDGPDDWDLYMALSFYYLATPIKNSQRYYPF